MVGGYQNRSAYDKGRKEAEVSEVRLVKIMENYKGKSESKNSPQRRIAEYRTNSMEQSPTSEADSHSASQKIPRLLWKPKVHYCVHNSLLSPRTCVTFHNQLAFHG
jgi:hypothetical protein